MISDCDSCGSRADFCLWIKTKKHLLDDEYSGIFQKLSKNVKIIGEGNKIYTLQKGRVTAKIETHECGPEISFITGLQIVGSIASIASLLIVVIKEFAEKKYKKNKQKSEIKILLYVRRRRIDISDKTISEIKEIIKIELKRS